MEQVSIELFAPQTPALPVLPSRSRVSVPTYEMAREARRAAVLARAADFENLSADLVDEILEFGGDVEAKYAEVSSVLARVPRKHLYSLAAR